MKQRGRPSKAKLSVVSEIAEHRPAPPKTLTRTQKAFWTSVVKTKPPDWWDAASIPLLEEYCRLKSSIDLLTKQEQKAEALIDELGAVPEAYPELVRIIDRKQARFVQLAMKMRLTQQARTHPTTAGRAASKAGETNRARPLWAQES